MIVLLFMGAENTSAQIRHTSCQEFGLMNAEGAKFHYDTAAWTQASVVRNPGSVSNVVENTQSSQCERETE